MQRLGNEGDAAHTLLVTAEVHPSPAGGRELLSKLNHDALREICGDGLRIHALARPPAKRASAARAALTGQIDGLTPEVLGELLRTIRRERISKVFVDGSNLGELTRVIKSSVPHVAVTTFFHNVEARFFWGALKQFGTVRAAGVLLANYLAERKAVRYSDNRICLSNRDSELLRAIYGRGATHVSAMALRDKWPTEPPPREGPVRDNYALFVGGTFYANIAGITWFVEHVVPRIGIKTYIVGKGFDAHKEALERNGNVVVVGAVDTLAPWYLSADFVVAPIFDGSGMKTKVAEALMFGKRVIGTPEAFSGYEDVATRVGAVCETANQFVTAIERYRQEERRSYDPSLRAIYEEKYSYPAALTRLRQIV